jgi:hypothetical protein
MACGPGPSAAAECRHPRRGRRPVRRSDLRAARIWLVRRTSCALRQSVRARAFQTYPPARSAPGRTPSQEDRHAHDGNSRRTRDARATSPARFVARACARGRPTVLPEPSDASRGSRTLRSARLLLSRLRSCWPYTGTCQVFSTRRSGITCSKGHAVRHPHGYERPHLSGATYPGNLWATPS